MARTGSARRLFKPGREVEALHHRERECKTREPAVGATCIRARWKRCPSDVRCAVLGAKLEGDDCVVIRVEPTGSSPMRFGLD